MKARKKNLQVNKLTNKQEYFLKFVKSSGYVVSLQPKISFV